MKVGWCCIISCYCFQMEFCLAKAGGRKGRGITKWSWYIISILPEKQTTLPAALAKLSSDGCFSLLGGEYPSKMNKFQIRSLGFFWGKHRETVSEGEYFTQDSCWFHHIVKLGLSCSTQLEPTCSVEPTVNFLSGSRIWDSSTLLTVIFMCISFSQSRLWIPGEPLLPPILSYPS